MDSTDHSSNNPTPVVTSTNDDEFWRRPSVYQTHRRKTQPVNNDWVGAPFYTLYGGVSARFRLFSETTIAFAVRDSTYLLDFTQFDLHSDKLRQDWLGNTTSLVERARKYQLEHSEKFISVAMSAELAERCPELCPRLWSELDIIPIVLQKKEGGVNSGMSDIYFPYKSLDEQAESFARKCVSMFGPNQAPALQIGVHGQVEVDAAFRIKLAGLSDYEKTVRVPTWSAINKFANDLKKRKVKIAFFGATPQGGGVALMRHAFVRFARLLGIELRWYVPKPRPGVFRITKDNHNILQGVAAAGTRFTVKQRDIIRDWTHENAERYWFRKVGPAIPAWLEHHGPPSPAWFNKIGPLVPPSEGGVDIVIIDDPQLAFLIPLIKQRTPDRPVIYRSHTQIRSDLVDQPGTPQAEAWAFLWEAIEEADLFISHPVSASVPKSVPSEKVGYIPSSTDWLDGLNKHMSDWNICHYGRIFNSQCREQSMPQIAFPQEDYIIQIARFDPSKGICDVLASYNKFYKLLSDSRPDMKPPKLLICGHISIDDPDSSIVYDAALEFVEEHLSHIKELICIMRLGPTDQMLNALVSKAKIVLQLSTREGFEVKVSEALHKGKPVIGTLAGGIPLQIQHDKNGFLVEVGDTNAVAEHLFELWTDKELYDRMSSYAATSVSDEVSTVGNMLPWLYLASKLSEGENIRPNKRWIDDMARENANELPCPPESRIKRVLQASVANYLVK